MKKRLLGVLMLTFLIGGGSLFTLAEGITVPSKTFDLGNGVIGNWNKDTQTLSVEGNGKINLEKWNELKKELDYRNKTLDEIRFASTVQFPDRAYEFFAYGTTAKIIIPQAMDVSNLTVIDKMFFETSNFHVDELRWNLPNLTSALSAFNGTTNFKGKVYFTNLNKLKNGAGLFAWSSIKEAHLGPVPELTTASAMFSSSAVEKVTISNLKKVTTANRMFWRAKKFHADHLNWELDSVENMEMMFDGTNNFKGEVHFTNLGKLTNAAQMFNDSSVTKVTFSETPNLTTTARMFQGAKTSDITLSNLKNVQDIEKMFNKASNFNWDISEWGRSKNLVIGTQFINNTKFSLESYDKLLIKWAEILPNAQSEVKIFVDAPYCLGYQARATLLTKGYKMEGDTLACELKWELEEKAPSKTSINGNVLKITSLIPGDKLVARKLDTTTATTSELNCTVIKPGSPGEIQCTFDVTSTAGGRLVEFEISDGATTQIVRRKFLIDNEGPELPQVKINMNNAIPEITLPQFPLDKGGSQTSICFLSYQQKDGKGEWKDEIQPGVALALSELPPISESHKVHTVKVQCQDKLWNQGETNVVTFPPVIEFNEHDTTLLSGDGELQGSFSIYSPSGNPIIELDIRNAAALGITSISCQGDKEPQRSTTLPSGGSWAIKGVEIANDATQKINCNYSGKIKKWWILAIRAQDKQWAAGENKQTFVLDTKPPQIDISSDSRTSSGTLIVEVRIQDNVKVEEDKVEILVPNFTTASQECRRDVRNEILCTLTLQGNEDEVVQGKIQVRVTDEAGNPNTLDSEILTIDKQKPTLTPKTPSFSEQGKIQHFSFTAEDAGVGLWKDRETGSDASSLTYGFASSQDCWDYEVEDTLTPETAEPFNLEIALNDNSKNGKYVCVQVKDKVWNLTSASLGQLKINQAPTLENTLKEIPENLGVGSGVLTLAGSDPNGDTLTYTITAGDDNQIFSIEGNQLKLNKKLDFEKTQNYTLTVTVTDPQGLSTTATVTITITDVDEDKPSIKPIANLSYTTNASITPIVLSGTDNNGITEWTVEGLPAGLSFDKDHLTIKGTLTAEVGNYPITVTAKDAEGNTTTLTFTLKVINRGYSGGGGGRVLNKKAEKPSTNEKKPESSDKAQTPVGEKKAYQENDLFNPNIEDGKCYTRRPHLGILTSQLIPTTEEYNKAQSFLWSYEMTKYDSVDGYDPYRYLSRQEAAKIFSNFAINVLCRQPNKKLTVNYSDTQDADPSLKPYIELAYQLGIMKGSGQGDGSFRPYEFISKAEVNAVLIRMLLKSYLDETGLLRYTPYNQTSHTLNIISQEAGLEPIARNHVALMLFRAYKQQSFDWKEIDYFSYVLKNRADFVK